MPVAVPGFAEGSILGKVAAELVGLGWVRPRMWEGVVETVAVAGC